MATFDVIMPAYNAARYIALALDSVIAQSFTDWRVVLVDDGSQDNTAEVLAPYRARLGDKLLYIRQANGGMSAARNTALRQSTAEFIALLDSDDVWLPNRLQTAFDTFRSKPAVGLVYGFVKFMNAAGEVTAVYDRANPHGEGRVAPFLYKRVLDIPCATVSFRRSCLEYAGLFDETLGGAEDRDLWIRIAVGTETALISEVVALYRVSAGSVSSNLDRMTRAQRQLIDKLYGQPGCGWRARRVALSFMHRQRAEASSAKGDHSVAIDHAFRALLLYPFQKSTVKIAAAILLRSAGWKRHATAANNAA